MALLFIDSFDHYVTADVGEKYAGGTGTPAILPTGGRRSGGALRLNNASVIFAALSVSGPTAVVGFAFKVSRIDAAAGAGLTITSGGSAQLTLTLATGGALEVRRGTNNGTLLGASSVLLSVGAFHYVELRATIHPSAGTVTLRINSAVTLDLTGVNTAATGVSAWTGLTLGIMQSGGADSDFDDLYVLDGSGSPPLNDFLGDVRVDARYPTGAGATTGWTPSAAPNWSCVDDPTPNDDTDYVSAASTSLKDTYTVQDAPVAGGTLYGVQLLLSVKKTDAGTCTVVPVVRHSTLDYPGASINPGTTYAYGRQAYGTNPGTGAAWTESDFNAAEFGITRTA